MKLHNTLSRQIELFHSIEPKKVKLYTCGPTVYDHQTIGNLRSYILYDTLKRLLTLSGYHVDHVMNITDVGHLTSDADEGDDKLEKGAQRSGKTVYEVAAHYTKLFKEDLKKLNVIEARLVKATEFIDQQIEFIKILFDKDFVYKTEQAIYFDVSKAKDYGRLAHQRLSEKETGARQEVITDSHKRQPQDFAVWFFTVGHFRDHSMRWPSPWGEGFPGWHLECSTIVHQTLKEPIDIHAGGVDLIGTHHTNEMAQTEAAFGHPLANYWVHGEHLLVDGQRMGKSLGNFYTLKDITEKGYSPLALRLLYLQAHYRTQLNFTWDSLMATQRRLRDWQALADLRWQARDDFAGQNSFAADGWQKARLFIEESLYEDLNTAQAITAVDRVASQTEVVTSADLTLFIEFLEFLDAVFGLDLSSREDIDSEQKMLIKKREEVRSAQDWRSSDELRQKLLTDKVEINDTAYGPRWRRK